MDDFWKKCVLLIILNGVLNVGCQEKLCGQLSLTDLLKRHEPCKLVLRNALAQANVTKVHNAAYAFNYWVPVNLKEVISKDAPAIDTARYISDDRKCSLKIWPGETVPFPLGTVDVKGKLIGIKAADIIRVEKRTDNYIELIKSGKEKHIGAVKILELCKGVNGYEFTISLKGKKGQRGYIYKIEVSELPVSGELIFKHFLYEYMLGAKSDAERMGLQMANDFGHH
jgi:hypothetical protein